MCNDLLSYFSAVASAAYFYFGLYCIKLNPKAKLNRLFFLVCLDLAVWALSTYFYCHASSESDLWFWLRSSALFWTNLPAASLAFSLVLSENRLVERKGSLALLFAPGLIFGLKEIFGHLTVSGFVRQSGGWHAVPALNSCWYFAWHLYYPAFMLLGLFLIFLWGRRSRSSLEKIQARLLIVTAFMSFFSDFFFETLLRTLSAFVSIPPLVFASVPPTSTLGMIWVWGMWRAVFKHRFMTITPAIAAEEILVKMANPVFLVDPQDRVVSLNPCAARLLKVSELEMRGAPFSKLFSRVEKLPIQLEHLSDPRSWECSGEIDFFNREGETIPLLVRGATIKDRAGELLGGVIVGEDLRPLKQLQVEISERRKAEEALKDLNEDLERRVEERTSQLFRSESRLRQITDNMHDLISQTDLNFTFQYASPSYKTLLGYAPEDLLGKSILEMVHPDDLAAVRLAIEEAISQASSGKMRMRIRHAEGHYRLMESFGSLLFDTEQRLVGAVFATRDITEWNRAEEEKARLQQEQLETLRQADHQKDEFLSVISHELRTPLNAIMGFASLLEDGVVGSLVAQQQEFVEKILASSDRMLSLVNDLLDLARIQAGKFEISVEAVAYPALVRDVAAMLAPQAREKAIEIVAEIDEAPLEICLDGQKVFQVLVNLVSNALKFTEEGGKILIRAYPQDGFLLTEVRDDGIGIASEDLSKLFTAFKQLDMSLTRKVGGTGLGLSISKGIVEAHGGTIEVSSPGLGLGSSFRFSLPL